MGKPSLHLFVWEILLGCLARLRILAGMLRVFFKHMDRGNHFKSSGTFPWLELRQNGVQADTEICNNAFVFPNVDDPRIR